VAGHFWDKVAACLGGGIGFYTLKQHQLVSVSDMDPPCHGLETCQPFLFLFWDLSHG
jgi:hypothetical protein